MSELRRVMQSAGGAIANLLETAAYFVVAATIAGFLSAFESFFDLFSHFRVQYLCLLILTVVPLVLRKKWLPAALVAAAIGSNLVEILPLYFNGGGVQKTTSATAADLRTAVETRTAVDTRTVKILDVNFNSRNSNFEALKALATESNADIICWQEFSADAEVWATKNFDSIYPYSRRLPRHDNFGIAIFSRLPVKDFEILDLSDVHVETLVATIDLNGRLFDVINTHPWPPVTASAYRSRNLQLENLAEYVKKSKRSSVICGDLNATSWCDSFKKLLRTSGLKDSRKGYGVQASWPTMIPLAMIPIDHVLVDPRIRVLNRRTGPSVFSDHLPVIVELAL